MATVVRDLRLAGKPAFPLLGPWEWLVHQSGWTGDGPIPVVGGSVFPLGGIPLATNVYCNETGQWFIYESDRYGFNNPDAIWSGGAPDLAIVGNSWALGACLPNGAAFPDRLRSRAPSLLNLSAGATGPLIRLGLVGEYASLVRPRTVLWLATAPDFTIGMAMEKEVPVLRRYLSGAKQGLPSLAADIGDYQKAYADRALPSLDQRGGARQRAPIRLAEFARLTKLRERLSLVSCPARSTDFAMFGKALSVARDSVAGWGGQLVFVFLPAWSDCDLVNPRASDNWLNRSIRRTAADAGIPVIDLYDLLAEQADPEDLYLYQGGHFSPKGADAAAKFIVERLKTLGRLP